MPRELAGVGFLLASRQELIVSLKEGNISKDVMLALFADVNGVTKVPQGRTDHIRGQNVPQLKFLSLLVVGRFQVDWGLGGHFGI